MYGVLFVPVFRLSRRSLFAAAKQPSRGKCRTNNRAETLAAANQRKAFVPVFQLPRQLRRLASVPGLPRSFTYAQFISACGAHINGEGLGLNHVRIVGGAVGKALLLFPEARSPSHLVEELLASRIICTTYGFFSIWLVR